jgi:hypothetical protein
LRHDVIPCNGSVTIRPVVSADRRYLQLTIDPGALQGDSSKGGPQPQTVVVADGGTVVMEIPLPPLPDAKETGSQHLLILVTAPIINYEPVEGDGTGKLPRILR